MSPKKTYVAVYERDPEDDAWNVHIQDLEGCQRYGRSLRQAQTRIREALGLWLDRDAQQLAIRDELPADLSAVGETVTRARREAEQAGTRAQEETTRAVKRLTDLGVSRRDAAVLLGLSHQRVQQLLGAS